jgi:hypothetical protein
MSIANSTAANWWGAAGSWTAYNTNGIPGFPEHTVTTGYMDIYIRYEPDYVSKWTYRKWSDGTAECWGTFIFNYAKAIAWGGCYWLNPYQYLRFPTNLFLSTPSITMTRTNGVEGFASFMTSDKDNINQIYLMRPANAAESFYVISFYAIGNWAEINPEAQTLLISSYSQKQMTKAEIQGLIEASGNQFKDNDTWIPSDLI